MLGRHRSIHVCRYGTDPRHGTVKSIVVAMASAGWHCTDEDWRWTAKLGSKVKLPALSSRVLLVAGPKLEEVAVGSQLGGFLKLDAAAKKALRPCFRHNRQRSDASSSEFGVFEFAFGGEDNNRFLSAIAPRN